jgi:hypothetical protein
VLPGVAPDLYLATWLARDVIGGGCSSSFGLADSCPVRIAWIRMYLLSLQIAKHERILSFSISEFLFVRTSFSLS